MRGCPHLGTWDRRCCQGQLPESAFAAKTITVGPAGLNRVLFTYIILMILPLSRISYQPTRFTFLLSLHGTSVLACVTSELAPLFCILRLSTVWRCFCLDSNLNPNKQSKQTMPRKFNNTLMYKVLLPDLPNSVGEEKIERPWGHHPNCLNPYHLFFWASKRL